MEQIIVEYAPIVIVVIYVLIRTHQFVTQKEMDDTIAKEITSIRKEFEDKFSTKEIADIIREDIKRLEDKIDTLIEYNLNRH